MSVSRQLQLFKIELEKELSNILGYWDEYCVDKQAGGFFGQVNNKNEVNKDAPKGLVLHARILWTYSAAYRLKTQPRYLELATHAYDFLETAFIDKDNGGMFWSVESTGQPLETKKQAYALAFALYGYSEYYAATGKEEARTTAIKLFTCLETNFYEPVYGGYLEALSAFWTPMEDLRLSVKDANEPKTMNTHLHILEAYTNLHRIWPVEQVKEKIRLLLLLFQQRILSDETGHLHLFFSIDWAPRSTIHSYGHDIEAAWLMLEAAEELQDENLIASFRIQAVRTANAATKGLDKDGGLWYETDYALGHRIEEKHWWPQAEAMVGFFNCWQITGEPGWLQKTQDSWRFIQEKIIDKYYGEWFWGIDRSGNVLETGDKAGFWKCPYHNGRACVELIHRINHKQTTI